MPRFSPAIRIVPVIMTLLLALALNPLATHAQKLGPEIEGNTASQTPSDWRHDHSANDEPPAVEWQGWQTAGQFLRLGFLHILPMGTDHILFVLGLYFLGVGWRALLTQTGVFTIAHTLTLGLSAYGIFSLPAALVEPLIALSIAYIAIENIWKPRLSPWRLVLVFCFGLLHGLGFASSISEVPMPRDWFFTALLSFNFGVDFGQLTVIALAFLLTGWWRNASWYRPRVQIPACAAIAAVGLYWTIERIATGLA